MVRYDANLWDQVLKKQNMLLEEFMSLSCDAIFGVFNVEFCVVWVADVILLCVGSIGFCRSLQGVTD